MNFDRSTRSVLAVILATAAVILAVNLLVRPEGMSGGAWTTFAVLLGLALILWAWNWREAYLEDRAEEAAEEEDLPLLPAVAATSARPVTAGMVMPPAPGTPTTPSPTPTPVVPPVPAPEPVTPPAPAPDIPPAPEPVTPPAPAPAEPPTPAPVEPPVPTPAEPPVPNPSPPPSEPTPPSPPPPPAEPAVPEGVADLAPAGKDSQTDAEAEKVVKDGKKGKPLEAPVAGGPTAAPEQPDAPKSPAKGKGKRAAAATDDFTRIEGIGKYYNDALHQIGYGTYAQLAADSPDAILAKLLGAGYRRHPTIPTWPEQAALAARADWDGLKALQTTLVSGRKAED